MRLVSKNNQLPFLAHMPSSTQGEPRQMKAQSSSLLLFGVGQAWTVSLSTSQFACGEARRTGVSPRMETRTEDAFSTAADMCK